MTQAANGTALELKRIVRMLDRAVEMAQDAELTGSLSEKSAAAVRSYNSIVTHLLSTAQISTALFEPLPADANLTDVAMASAQLAEYLRAGLPEEEQHERRGGLVIGNLNLGGGDQDELSEKIREHLAEFFGAAKPGAAPEGAQGSPDTSASAAPANAEPAPGRRAALPSQGRVEELRAEGQGAEVRRQ